MPANPRLKHEQEKQSLSERVGEMSTESHMWWATDRREGRRRRGEGERDEKKRFFLYTTVPETHVTLIPPQWVTLTGYWLCSLPPLCDWWASFCQLMENPLLTTIRLPFVTVSVSDCHRFILIRDLFLRLFYCASNLQSRVHSNRPWNWPAALVAINNLFSECTASTVKSFWRSQP